jgi:predicted small secreted protein
MVMKRNKVSKQDLLELKKLRTDVAFNLVSRGSMSWATAAFYILLTDLAHIKEPINELSLEEINQAKKRLKNIDGSVIDYHIRKLKKIKLLSTIYEFEVVEGKVLKVNNYKAALKLGIRGMKRSYLLFKELGEE